jgi:hypothetical protein
MSAEASPRAVRDAVAMVKPQTWLSPLTVTPSFSATASSVISSVVVKPAWCSRR